MSPSVFGLRLELPEIDLTTVEALLTTVGAASPALASGVVTAPPEALWASPALTRVVSRVAKTGEASIELRDPDPNSKGVQTDLSLMPDVVERKELELTAHETHVALELFGDFFETHGGVLVGSLELGLPQIDVERSLGLSLDSGRSRSRDDRVVRGMDVGNAGLVQGGFTLEQRRLDDFELALKSRDVFERLVNSLFVKVSEGSKGLVLLGHEGLLELDGLEGGEVGPAARGQALVELVHRRNRASLAVDRPANPVVKKARAPHWAPTTVRHLLAGAMKLNPALDTLNRKLEPLAVNVGEYVLAVVSATAPDLAKSLLDVNPQVHGGGDVRGEESLGRLGHGGTIA
jgi:hypothetical protein